MIGAVDFLLNPFFLEYPVLEGVVMTGIDPGVTDEDVNLNDRYVLIPDPPIISCCIVVLIRILQAAHPQTDADHKDYQFETAHNPRKPAFRCCERLVFGRVLTASQCVPFSCENSGWQSAFECMNYVELTPIKLTKRQNHLGPHIAENHSARTEDDESRTNYAVCCVLTQKKAYGGQDDGIDGKEKGIDVLPTRDQGFRGPHDELVLLKQYRNFGVVRRGGFAMSE